MLGNLIKYLKKKKKYFRRKRDPRFRVTNVFHFLGYNDSDFFSSPSASSPRVSRDCAVFRKARPFGNEIR